MKPDKITIHCSASNWGDVGVIDQWHKERGWKGIGYHGVICNGYPDYTSWAKRKILKRYDGLIEYGRPETETGAHVLGHNRKNLGVCLIGIDIFTENQMKSVINWVIERLARYHIPHSMVFGHNEFPGHETRGCPNIDMNWFRKQVLDEIIKRKILTW